MPDTRTSDDPLGLLVVPSFKSTRSQRVYSDKWAHPLVKGVPTLRCDFSEPRLPYGCLQPLAFGRNKQLYDPLNEEQVGERVWVLNNRGGGEGGKVPNRG